MPPRVGVAYPSPMRIGAGRFRNAELPPVGPGVRPVPARLRHSLFTLIEPWVRGAAVLDLCAGVGGLGLEALSRGASRAVLVDLDRPTLAALARWIEHRGVGGEVAVVRADARRGGWPPGPYDLVFLDPPFDVWAAPAGITPFLSRAVAELAPEGLVVVKAPGGAPVPENPRWVIRAVRRHGDVAYALLSAGAPTELDPVGPPGPGGDVPPRA